MKQVKNYHEFDEGFSLLEVLIAIVVLSIVGVALLKGISSGDLQANKSSNNQNNFDYMTAAAENISRIEFTTCNSRNPKPTSYILALSNGAESLPVEIEAVYGYDQGLSPNDAKWINCENWDNDREGRNGPFPPSFLQKIVLKNINYIKNNCQKNPNNASCRRTVFKNKTNFSGITPTLSLNQFSPIGIFYGRSRIVTLSTSPINTNMFYFILPGSKIASECSDTNFSAMINNDSGAITLCVGASYSPSQSNPSKRIIEIGGFDRVTSTYATPASLTVDLYPPITLSQPNPTPVTEPNMARFGNYLSLQLKASGGNGFNYAYYADSSHPLPAGLILNSNGEISWTTNATGFSTIGNQSIYLLIGGGGQEPSESTRVYFNLSVKDPLSFANYSGLGSNSNPCISGSCNITLNTTMNTGVGNVIASYTPTISSNLSNVTFSNIRYTFNQSNWQWIITFDVSYNRSISTTGFCKSKTSGTAYQAGYTMVDNFNTSVSANRSTGNLYLKCG